MIEQLGFFCIGYALTGVYFKVIDKFFGKHKG